MKLASLKGGRDGRLRRGFARPHARGRCLRGGADVARGAGRLGRRRAAAAGDREFARSRPHRPHAVRSEEMRRALAAQLRLGRRLGLRQSRGAGSQIARRRGAADVLDRSADVSRRVRRVHRPLRSDPRRRHRLGHRSRSRGGGGGDRRAAGRDAGADRLAHQAFHAGRTTSACAISFRASSPRASAFSRARGRPRSRRSRSRRTNWAPPSTARRCICRCSARSTASRSAGPTPAST